jgi:2-polyprenyl-3-methyl-5-hydroxy-6-metoxy-1,4-benzoquinol methylase
MQPENHHGKPAVSSPYPMMEWTPEKVARFWDYQSRYPDNYFTFQVGKDLIKQVERYFPQGASTRSPTAGRVLDYGCGMGFLMRHLLDKRYRVAGLDFSADSVEGVRKKFGSEPEFLGADLVDAYVARSETFDVIFVVEVIEHLDDAYLAATMRNVRNLLSEKGIVVFTTPNEEVLSDNHVYCAECNHVFHVMQHVRAWSAETLGGYLREQGLIPKAVFSTRFAPSRRVAVQEAVKAGVKRLLGRRVRLPHLVAVCTADSR